MDRTSTPQGIWKGPRQQHASSQENLTLIEDHYRALGVGSPYDLNLFQARINRAWNDDQRGFEEVWYTSYDIDTLTVATMWEFLSWLQSRGVNIQDMCIYRIKGQCDYRSRNELHRSFKEWVEHHEMGYDIVTDKDSGRNTAVFNMGGWGNMFLPWDDDILCRYPNEAYKCQVNPYPVIFSDVGVRLSYLYEMLYRLHPDESIELLPMVRWIEFDSTNDKEAHLMMPSGRWICTVPASSAQSMLDKHRGGISAYRIEHRRLMWVS